MASTEGDSKLSFAAQQLKICLQLATIKVDSPATCNNYDKSDGNLQQLQNLIDSTGNN